MDIKWKAFVMATRCMVLIAAIGLFPGPDCSAADHVSKIRSITPLIEMSALPGDAKAEDYFDIVGPLNLIEGSRVVIGNTSLELSGGTSTSGVKLDDQVGARLNQKGEIAKIVLISDVPN